MPLQPNASNLHAASQPLYEIMATSSRCHPEGPWPSISLFPLDYCTPIPCSLRPVCNSRFFYELKHHHHACRYVVPRGFTSCPPDAHDRRQHHTPTHKITKNTHNPTQCYLCLNATINSHQSHPSFLPSLHMGLLFLWCCLVVCLPHATENVPSQAKSPRSPPDPC